MENNQTMKASELRIGNLVLIDSNEVKIDNIADYGINGYYWHQSSTFDYNYEFGKNKIEGIPLTEEWLSRMQFKKYKTILVDTHNYVFGDFKWNDALPILSYRSITLLHIKYVHQLQNLYFALTNQELEIKES